MASFLTKAKAKGAIDISILGVPELQKKLAALPWALQRKIMRKALRLAGKPVLATAKAMVPVDTGALKKGLKLRAIKRNSRGIIGVRVTTPSREALGLEKDEAYYPAVLEFGIQGKPAHPYMRPAIETNRSKSLDIIKTEVAKGLEQEAARPAASVPPASSGGDVDDNEPEAGAQVHVGKRGGRFYRNKQGNKVYLKRR